MDILLVKRLQDSVSGTVRCSAGSHCLVATKILALAAKSTLVNVAIIQAGKRHAGMFKFIDYARRHLTHKLNRILVTEIIATLDGIEHVPMPLVGRDIGQRRIHATLCGHRMRARGEYFGNHGNAGIRLCELQCGP